MRSDRLWRYLVCIGCAALLLRLLGPGWRGGFPTTFPDSSSYQSVAAHGVFSVDFWFGERPPTYPLLVWLVGPSTRAVVVAQTLMAVAAWAWLASTAWALLRHRGVAMVAAGGLLLIAIETRFVFWHTQVLTESLSATLAVAGVAAWWRWFHDSSVFRTSVATAITIAWMLVRDSNAVTMTVVAVPAAIVAAVVLKRSGGDRWRLGAIALTALVIAGSYSVSAQNITNRGETSVHNNVGLRWLPDPDMSAWMQARGLPVDDALLARSGGDAWADGEAMLRAPELQEYRDWANGRGKTAAALSFVLRADWYLGELDRELPVHTSSDHLAYDTFGVAEQFPSRPSWVLGPSDSRASVYIWTLLVAAALAVLWLRSRAVALLGLFLFVPVVVDIYLSYTADAVEVGRHLVGPLQRFAVVSLTVVALAADALLTTRRRFATEETDDVDGNGADDRDHTAEVMVEVGDVAETSVGVRDG